VLRYDPMPLWVASTPATSLVGGGLHQRRGVPVHHLILLLTRRQAKARDTVLMGAPGLPLLQTRRATECLGGLIGTTRRRGGA